MLVEAVEVQENLLPVVQVQEVPAGVVTAVCKQLVLMEQLIPAAEVVEVAVTVYLKQVIQEEPAVLES
jgi:hypothetical protein